MLGHWLAHPKDLENPRNNLVDFQTHRVLAVIRANTGWDHANFNRVLPSRWSTDGSLLLWKVDGKWSPTALVLLKIENGEVRWQLDLLKTAQHAVLLRTRKAAPEQYGICKKHNAGDGSAFPEGFTVDVTTDGEDTNTVSLPLGVHADLTANPKQIEGDPNLDSHLDGVVTPDGNFVVKDFHLGSQKQW
jgi:hypothetical protein